MDEANKSLEAYEKLNQRLPSIGFLSRKKRIIAFIKVSKLAQQLIDKQDISEDNALYLLSVLTRKSPSFRKAATMAALNLQQINQTALKAIGFKFANNLRCNMQLLPVDEVEL